MINEIAWLDAETTGPDPEKDRIVELCITITDMELNQLHPPIVQRINPETPIPQEATEVHGITNQMVIGQPTIADLADDLISILDNRHIGTYNGIRFDIPLVLNELHRVGKYININKEGRMLPDALIIFHEFEKRDLSAAHKFYLKKEMENAHTASADVEATINIAKAQMEMYGIKDVQEFYNLSKPEERFDFARKVIIKDNVPVFNFGKHIYEPIEDHQGYVEWMLAQDFPLDTKNRLSKELKKWKQKQAEEQPPQ